MIPLSVCLETVFTDLPVEERIAKIAEAGFDVVEFWHPEGTWDGNDIRFEAKDAASMKKACRQNGVTISDFALHAWDGSIGGCPVRTEDHEMYWEQIRKMLAFAREIGCNKGITLSGVADPALSKKQMRENLERAFARAAEIAEKEDFTLLVEPLNTLVDHPGYYLDSTKEAAEIVRAIKSTNLKILYDVYHMQIMEGRLIDTIEKNIDIIGHLHSAGVPGRAELFDTEVNYPVILRKLEDLGYKGNFGLEYFPKMADHNESLKRIREYLQ